MTGSEKQIAWAEKIKAGIVEKIEAVLVRLDERAPKRAEAERAAVSGLLADPQMDKAEIWINFFKNASPQGFIEFAKVHAAEGFSTMLRTIMGR